MNQLESLHKEIDLIQGVINRMAHNSFLLKGWMVSLVAVVLSLSKETLLTNDFTYLGLILCIPILSFWYLDAFFLHKEKCYRKLYQWVIENRPNNAEHLYSLNYLRFKKSIPTVFKIMFSATLLSFYGISIIISISITVFNIIS